MAYCPSALPNGNSYCFYDARCEYWDDEFNPTKTINCECDYDTDYKFVCTDGAYIQNHGSSTTTGRLDFGDTTDQGSQGIINVPRPVNSIKCPTMYPGTGADCEWNTRCGYWDDQQNPTKIVDCRCNNQQRFECKDAD